jgi:hypothetical protein
MSAVCTPDTSRQVLGCYTNQTNQIQVGKLSDGVVQNKVTLCRQSKRMKSFWGKSFSD